MMTKSKFLEAYEAELLANHAWAADAGRRAKFMAGVRDTLTGHRASWNFDGPSTVAAWRAIGGKGKQSLKALRDLRDE